MPFTVFCVLFYNQGVLDDNFLCSNFSSPLLLRNPCMRWSTNSNHTLAVFLISIRAHMNILLGITIKVSQHIKHGPQAITNPICLMHARLIQHIEVMVIFWDKVGHSVYYILAQYIGLLVNISSKGSTYLKSFKANQETRFGNLKLDLHNISH